jgi:hypothetical protein
MRGVVYMAFWLLLFGCNGIDVEYNDLGFELVEVETVSFDLDSITTFQNNNTQVVKIDGDNYILGFDANQGHLNFFHIDERMMKNKIILSKIGDPNGVNIPMSIDFINEDSILVYGYGQGLFLMNSKSEIIKSFDAGYLTDDGNSGDALILGASKINYFENKVYFSTYPRNMHRNTLFEYDLLRGHTKHFTPYPKYYMDIVINYYSVWSDFNKESGEAITSFSLEDSLHVYKTNHGHDIKILAKSQYFEMPSPKDLKNRLSERFDEDDLRKATVLFHENSQYGPVLYDETLKAYFRICYLPLDRQDLSGGTYFRDFSIVVVSESGEILADHLVRNEEGRFMVMYPEAVWFAFQGELYIQTANINSENRLEYVKFSLEKNDL